MVSVLDHPFHVLPGIDPASLVRQVFCNNNPGLEPWGYRYPDGSVWYVPAAGAAGGNWHNGVDYKLDFGIPLYAPADGVVVFSAWGAPNTVPIDTRGFGNCIVLRHDAPRLYTLYGHLSQIEVVPNQTVARGHEIGRVGSTGNSTGPHLHWSVILVGNIHYVDPNPYLTAQQQSGIHAENFTVTADADGMPVRVFAGPSRQFPELRVEQPGAAINCTGWTFGEPRLDRSTGQLDSRWYRVAGGGWVASARVTGNAPNSTPSP